MPGSIQNALTFGHHADRLSTGRSRAQRMCGKTLEIRRVIPRRLYRYMIDRCGISTVLTYASTA
jgi:hypothetical protein